MKSSTAEDFYFWLLPFAFSVELDQVIETCIILVLHRVLNCLMCQFKQVYQAKTVKSQGVNNCKMAISAITTAECQHENNLKPHKVACYLTIIFSKRSITSFSDKFIQRSSTSAWASGISLIEG